MTEHQYLKPVYFKRPDATCRRIATHLLNSYLNVSYSSSKWQKTPSLEVEWMEKETPKLGQADFDAMVRQLHTNRKVIASDFGLPRPVSPLFDASVDIGLPQAIVGSDGGTVKFRLPTALGELFPLVPRMDREGLAITDMQALVERNVIDVFRRLVETSHLAPFPQSGWLTEFRLLIADCVTAVEIMLHKVYLLAEYRGKELGWRFDRTILGERHGRRVADKLKWVSRISGKAFALPPDVHAAFIELKNLRNHLSHFDPPCFSATVLEFCGWLNKVREIGRILWMVRSQFKQQLSETTVELLLLPTLEFCGKSAFDRVPPKHDQTIGYRSASWPSNK